MNKKAYIYISLICVLSLVLSCLSVGATSASITISSYPESGYMNLIHQSTPQYDSTDNPISDVAEYTYQGNFDVQMYIAATDSYCNGFIAAGIQFSFVTPSGFTFDACNIQFNNLMNTDTCFAFARRNNGPTGGTQYIRCYFDNHWLPNAQYITLCNAQFTVTISKQITTGNLPDAPERISFSTSSSLTTNSTVITPDAGDNGLCGVISNGIINALNSVDGPLDDIMQYIQDVNDTLDDINSINQAWYAEIVDELLANNQWNSTITDYLIALYQELSLNTTTTINIASYTADLRTFMQTFPTWSSQVLTLLSKLADMNASQQTEAAAIASQYDSLQQQQDNANAVIEGVARPTFAQGQFSGNNLVPQGQRGTFTGFLALITSNNYITTILLIIMTFATAGFVLFGKKK